MGSVCLCGGNPIFRLVLLGNDNIGKAIIYSRLADGNMNPGKFESKMVHIYETDFLLCKEIKKQNSRCARKRKIPFGVIFVIDMKEPDLLSDVLDDFDTLMQTNLLEKMNVLVLCNDNMNHKIDIEFIFWQYLNYSNLKVCRCDITGWFGVDQGLRWLCNKMRAS